MNGSLIHLELVFRKNEKKDFEYRQNVILGYRDSLCILGVCLLLRGSCAVVV